MHTASPSTEPASAVQRAGSGLRSWPIASTATPKAIGTQMAAERRYPWRSIVVVVLELLQVQPEEGEEREHAEDHRERVVVDEAGLRPARDAGEPADESRRAVHHDPVDHRLVAPGPQARAELARATGEEPVVELVEAVLALEDRGQHAEPRLDPGGQVRTHDVEQPCEGEPGEAEVDGQRGEGVQHHRPPAV